MKYLKDSYLKWTTTHHHQSINQSIMKLFTILTCAIPLSYAITLKPRSRVTENRIILAPSSNAKGDTEKEAPRLLQPIDKQSKEPKLFVPEIEWKVVPEDEILPRDGLDIRMNLETGLKEAKLSDQSVTNDYTFTTQFNDIYSSIEHKDYPQAQLQIDDLLEFVHDYKYGHDIITHEWASLSQIILNNDLPSSLREIVVRLIISGMRNNPPVIDYIRVHSTSDLVSTLFYEINNNSSDLILLKRFITFLEQYLTPNDIIPKYLSILFQTYKLSKDKQLNWKILEIVSKYYNDNQFSDLPHDSLWFDTFLNEIQDPSIDEWQLRTFFKTLYNIKLQYDTELTIPSNYLNWLNNQIESRSNLNLEERDEEQLSFDKLLKQSRHKIFGNPLADRMKHFDDEL